MAAAHLPAPFGYAQGKPSPVGAPLSEVEGRRGAGFVKVLRHPLNWAKNHPI